VRACQQGGLSDHGSPHYSTDPYSWADFPFHLLPQSHSRCIVKSCSRRARAHTFLWAAVADTLVVALLSSGITGHPYQSVAHLVPSALRYACTAVARCMQLQVSGALRLAVS
jgi:hypothetical protein